MVYLKYFGYNSAEYQANFVILFLLLLEMISALNLLKHFPPHLTLPVLSPYLVKLVTFNIIFPYY